jgi:hypothetical protein
MHSYIHTYINTYIHIHTYYIHTTYTFTHTYIHLYYIYTHIYIHIHTYNTYTQVWIGPAQQTGQPCSLLWPYADRTQCIMSGFQNWKNIVLRNIYIRNPRGSPGGTFPIHVCMYVFMYVYMYIYAYLCMMLCVPDNKCMYVLYM